MEINFVKCTIILNSASKFFDYFFVSFQFNSLIFPQINVAMTQQDKFIGKYLTVSINIILFSIIGNIDKFVFFCIEIWHR